MIQKNASIEFRDYKGRGVSYYIANSKNKNIGKIFEEAVKERELKKEKEKLTQIEITNLQIHPITRPDKISEWTKDHVLSFIKSDEVLDSVAEVFYKQDIDGQVLLSLEEKDIDDIFKELKLTFGQKRKFKIVLSNLKDKVKSPSRTGNRFGEGLDTLSKSVNFYSNDYKPSLSLKEVAINHVGHLFNECLSKVENMKLNTLSEDEKAILNLYTQDTFYKQLNRIMRSGTDEERNLFKDAIYYIDFCLKKLPIFKDNNNHIYRGISGLYDDYYSPGKIICWPAFSSTTKSVDIALKFVGTGKGTLFSIIHKNARYIAPISQFPDEEECLLFSNTKIRIISRWSDSQKALLGTALKVDLSELVIFEVEEI